MCRVELKANSPLSWLKPRLIVPNVPCGVERYTRISMSLAETIQFLMCRVELKDVEVFVELLQYLVPNVPCGVERSSSGVLPDPEQLVPNVPCGVESHANFETGIFDIEFLMCRVELKDRGAS